MLTLVCGRGLKFQVKIIVVFSEGHKLPTGTGKTTHHHCLTTYRWRTPVVKPASLPGKSFGVLVTRWRFCWLDQKLYAFLFFIFRQKSHITSFLIHFRCTTRPFLVLPGTNNFSLTYAIGFLVANNRGLLSWLACLHRFDFCILHLYFFLV